MGNQPQRVKNYLIYGWHVLLLVLILGVIWRVQNPPWQGITVPAWQDGDFYGVKIRCPYGPFTVGRTELRFEDRTSNLTIEMTRAKPGDEVWDLVVDGQFYGRVKKADRVEISRGPEVKVNGEDRYPRPADEATGGRDVTTRPDP